MEILKFKFLPAEITIAAGDSIRWTNKEKRQYHSVWFEQLGEPEPDYLFPGDFYERTFDEAGDFPYRCGPHPEMTGMVHVKPANGAEAPPEKGPEENQPDSSGDTDTETAAATKTASLPGEEILESRREEMLYILKHDCGSCHGMTLQGGLGPSLKPDALEKLSQEQVAVTINHGRPGTPMPPWKPFFSEQEALWLAQQLKQGIEERMQ
ncbi:MAG: c-type cytochrome [Pseudomonadota bacterium]